MSGFYVEFEVAGEPQFHKLADVFAALKVAKENDDWKDDTYWLAFFDDTARAHFWWPTEEELKDWERRWFSTPVETRFTDPSLRMGWDFGSMIEAFRNGEYDFVACRRTSGSRARIEFDPHADPYGGTGSMRALVEAFGHRVVHVSD